MPRLITIIIAFAATLTLAAGCDPVVQRKFDVLLTDRTKGSKVEVVDGQLADVMAIVEEVVNRWDFESQPLDPKARRIGYLGGWTRGDVGGVTISMYKCSAATPITPSSISTSPLAPKKRRRCATSATTSCSAWSIASAPIT